MMHFIESSGIFGIPLLILTLVNLFLIIRTAVWIITGNGADPRLDSGLMAILFWGFTAAVMGFLGQCSGLYRALTVISQASAVDPRIMMIGFAESFSSTIWGGGLLLLSGLAWFILRTWRRVATTSVAKPQG